VVTVNPAIPPVTAANSVKAYFISGPPDEGLDDDR
jgi:hypothetical protein